MYCLHWAYYMKCIICGVSDSNWSEIDMPYGIPIEINPTHSACIRKYKKAGKGDCDSIKQDTLCDLFPNRCKWDSNTNCCKTHSGDPFNHVRLSPK